MGSFRLQRGQKEQIGSETCPLWKTVCASTYESVQLKVTAVASTASVLRQCFLLNF